MSSTIHVDDETKERLASFGKKGESYKDIINKLYDIAVEHQLREFLYSKKAVPIDEAISRAKKKWQS